MTYLIDAQLPALLALFGSHLDAIASAFEEADFVELGRSRWSCTGASKTAILE